MDNSNSHTDSRGTITDLMVTDEYSVTHISFKKGSVRGNHLHKETTQFDVVLKGRLKFVKRDTMGRKLVLHGGPLDKFKVKPGQPHAYEAVEDSEMISICIGKRRGEHYEEDTFRLPDDQKLV